MFTKVIIATDLSEYSDSLVRCMQCIKSLGICDVILFHACGIRHLDEVAKLVKLSAEPQLSKQKTELELNGFNVQIQIAPGAPSLELKNIVEKFGGSLIIVSSPKVSHMGHLISRFGGFTSEILHTHEIPLLLIRSSHTDEGIANSEIQGMEHTLNEKILFATDFSEISTNAFQYLCKLVSPTCNKITLMHVQDKTHIEKHLIDKLDDFNKIDQTRLERLKEDLPLDFGTEIQIKIKYGIPGKEILEESKEGYSLVIMGSQGRGFFHEVFIGSVSHYVYQKVNTSLLLIPAKTRLNRIL